MGALLQVKAAWEWLWAWLSQILAQSLEDARNEATIITQSWDIAVDNYEEIELGGLLFDTLFELAPNLKPIYKKPRQVGDLQCNVFNQKPIGKKTR